MFALTQNITNAIYIMCDSLQYDGKS